MAAGSPFFARIKNDLKRIVEAVPAARVITYASAGAYLDVAPRHVAYILSTLNEIEREIIPWHRVVAADGTLGPSKKGERGLEQIARLSAEGVAVLPDGRLRDFNEILIDVLDVPSGVPKQTRPSDAPSARSRVRRR